MTDLGFFLLDTACLAAFAISDKNKAPQDPSSAPIYRIYNGQTLMTGGTGTLSQVDTGAITNATNANPIVITSVGHGLLSGTQVTITGVLGNTAANGTFVITKLTGDTFSIPAIGNAGYISGGTWHVTGLYGINHSLASGNGYEAGQTYTILVNYSVGSDNYAETFTFTVV